MKNNQGYVENLYTTDCIRTVNGIYVNVFDPKPEMFLLDDIAHALSRQCRFGGHLKEFYSVAQHSYMCSFGVPSEFALQGLLHDASEAYMCDIPSPIKANFPEYKIIENNVMKVISEKFGIEYPFHKSIKNRDRELLEYEWELLMLGKNEDMKHIKVDIWDFKTAKENFINRFKELKNGN